MKTFGLSLLSGVGGYFIGLFGGMWLINSFSSNTHDRSVEAAMTAAFVIGPLTALVGCAGVLTWRLMRSGK